MAPVGSVNWTWTVYFVSYMTTAILIGIGLSLLVEFPMLRLRDRLYPSRANPLEVKAEG